MSTVLSDDDAKQRLAENVQRLLNERGWKQADLARATGEQEARVSTLLRGTVMPGAAFIARVADVLNVSIDYLFAASRKNSRQTA